MKFIYYDSHIYEMAIATPVDTVEFHKLKEKAKVVKDCHFDNLLHNYDEVIQVREKVSSRYFNCWIVADPNERKRRETRIKASEAKDHHITACEERNLKNRKDNKIVDQSKLDKIYSEIARLCRTDAGCYQFNGTLTEAERDYLRADRYAIGTDSNTVTIKWS